MKKYITCTNIILVFSFFSILHIGITAYNQSQDMAVLKKLAEIVRIETVGATGGCPSQFGGTKSVVINCSVSDQMGNCTSCPQTTSNAGRYKCAGYSEVNFEQAGGDGAIISVPKDTKFLGGGNTLKTGVSIMTCSLSDTIHYGVAISP